MRRFRRGVWEDDGGRAQEELASWKMKTSNVENRKARRQFNSALGIGIDAPAGQPQTNAYDVHNAQQGAAPWESANGGYQYVR